MDLLRGSLSLFALLNAAGWAALAAAWRFRPELAERLPLQLGTHERYRKFAPVWARLAAALYLTAGHNTPPFIIIGLFTAAAACLIVAIVAAGAVFSAVRPDPLPVALEGSEQAL